MTEAKTEAQNGREAELARVLPGLDSESIDFYFSIWRDDDSVAVPEVLWKQHPMLAALQELQVSDRDFVFYATGQTPEQIRAWQEVTLRFQDCDSNHRFFTCLERGVDRRLVDSTTGEAVHADVWWAGRIWDELWGAVIPGNISRAATAQVVTDLAAGTVSDDDREAFLRRGTSSNNRRDLQRERWTWTDDKILTVLESERP